jgi:hypothetical protein
LFQASADVTKINSIRHESAVGISAIPDISCIFAGRSKFVFDKVGYKVCIGIQDLDCDFCGILEFISNDGFFKIDFKWIRVIIGLTNECLSIIGFVVTLLIVGCTF